MEVDVAGGATKEPVVAEAPAGKPKRTGPSELPWYSHLFMHTALTVPGSMLYLQCIPCE